MMQIITVPHRSLRQVAKPVTVIDVSFSKFAQQLQQTLSAKQHPRGVGLAAPQVNRLWRMFALQLPQDTLGNGTTYSPIELIINPVITDHSQEMVYGPPDQDETLEGCLSIPSIYGPVPRWPALTLRYDQLVGMDLQPTTRTFRDFAARVVQHEVDHLDGKLFIDYAPLYDLPLYQDDKKTNRLVELSPDMVTALLFQSQGNA